MQLSLAMHTATNTLFLLLVLLALSPSSVQSFSLQARTSFNTLSTATSCTTSTSTATARIQPNQHQYQHQYQYQHQSSSISTTGLHASTNNNNNNNNDSADATKKLLEKAARLREEIAALEGKSVAQVEQEAKEKKDAKIEAERKSKEVRATATPFDKGRMLNIPESTDQMISQAARAIQMAHTDGIVRQTVQLALVAEGESMMELNQWPGGAQQMYREAAKPLTRALLKEINISDQAVLPPNVIDKDVWDFDGSALMTAEAQEGEEHDVQALVFANTDVKYVRDIAQLDEDCGPNKLLLLVNPFWRNLESWGVNVMAPGAKALAKKVIFDPPGYAETYVFLRFSVRGELCAAVKAYPYDWQLFAYLEDESGWERPIRLGSSEVEPTSELITNLLNERDEFKQTKIMRQFK